MTKLKTTANVTVILKNKKWFCGDLEVSAELLFSGKYKFISLTAKKVVLSIKRIPKEWKTNERVVTKPKSKPKQTVKKSKKNVTKVQKEPKATKATSKVRTSNIIDPNRKIIFIDDRSVGAADRIADKKRWKKQKAVPRIRPAATTVEKRCYVCNKTELISSGLAACMHDTSYRCNQCNGAK